MSKKKKHKGKFNADKFKRNLRKELFGVFELQPNKPLNYKQIAGFMGIDDPGIRKLIQAMIEEELEKNYRDELY